MSQNKSKKPDDSNNGVNVVAAAVTGVVVGAGMVAAGVAAMRNDSNREKAKEMMDEVKSKASMFMKTASDEVDNEKDKVEKTAKVTKDTSQKVKKIWQK